MSHQEIHQILPEMYQDSKMQDSPILLLMLHAARQTLTMIPSLIPGNVITLMYAMIQDFSLLKWLDNNLYLGLKLTTLLHSTMLVIQMETTSNRNTLGN